jgi:hypothetical protein
MSEFNPKVGQFMIHDEGTGDDTLYDSKEEAIKAAHESWDDYVIYGETGPPVAIMEIVEVFRLDKKA